MTLDELIETLVELRARYPGAGTAYVNWPFQVSVDEPLYEYGEVQLGGPCVPADEDDEEADDVVH